jgi:hypothetical protein
MKKILNFNSFINEALVGLKDPAIDSVKLANILKKQEDAKEQPKGSNKGPEVSQYLASTGLGPGHPWCMAFVYYIFNQLCKDLGTPNPLPKTAGVKYHWSKAPAENKISINDVRNNISLLRPGQIFIMSRGKGKGLGHTGIIVSVDQQAKTFTSMEGNTNDQKSGEGHRVGKNTRNISDKALIGFVDYFKQNRTKEFEDNISKNLTGKISNLIPPILDPNQSNPFPGVEPG